MKTLYNYNETARLETLRQYQILDTEPEEAFDNLTRLAAHICGTPIALISFIDENRQWFKSKVGLDVTYVTRKWGICPRCSLLQDVVVVSSNTLADECWAANPVFTSPDLRFYAGVSLMTPQGYVLGHLCVMDYKEKHLNSEQLEGLRLLGRQVLAQLEIRRNLVNLTSATSRYQQAEESLQQQRARERLVTDIAHRIRQSLNLEAVLNTTVSEVRQFLQTERVFIYRFDPDWGGVVVVESVAGGWKSLVGSSLKDPTFAQSCIQSYKEGRLQATTDIYASSLPQCYIDFLAQFQVRATIIVPILQGEQLWGLLVANHCSSPRQWQQLEIDLLKQLATQLAIALQQSQLYEQIQIELNERKLREQKICEQAALLDVAKDAILVQDLQNRIVFWNQGAERLYGWLAHEARLKHANDLLFQGTSPQLQDIYKEVAQKSEWQGELTQVQKDGQKIIVESRWTLVRDLEGQPKSILVVNTDITEKKQLEAQFLRSQRLESVGTLASGMAHELNNMLTPILMSVQLLRIKLPDEQSQRLIERLETSVKRSAALVKQVLSFARGVSGDRTILQLKHLIEEVEQIAKHTFPKSIQILTDIPDNLCSVSGDATQLQQVLMNLAANARDVMPDGGILRMCAKNQFIDENFARINLEASVGAYIVITVSDTGMGIEPEILDRIFDPFFTTKDIGKGTGLGLSTVMGIIKSHGGFVNVASEVGLGSQFQVYLPAVSEAFRTGIKHSDC